jgi:DNA-binding XRE family transcriptional regulator
MILGKAVFAYRSRWNLSVRAAAKLIGIPYKTLWFFEQGKEVHSSSLIKIITWTLNGDHNTTKSLKGIEKV